MISAQRRTWIGLAAGCLLPLAALAASPETHVLSCTTGVFSLDVPIDLREREVVFRKEPDFGARDVVRGAIATGAGQSDFVGFAVDLGKRALYLDRNRNLDLTDDPPRTLTTEEIPGYVHFENVNLDLPVGGATVSYVFDLACYGSGKEASCELRCRSAWQGDVALGGSMWTLCVMDNLDGVIDGQDLFILRKSEGKAEAGAVSEMERLPATTNLCVDGQAVSLAFAFKGEGASSGLEIVVTPSGVPMGGLRVEGAGIRRILLFGPCSVVLDHPAGTVSLPVGHYDKAAIYVRDEDSPGELFAADGPPLGVAAEGSPAFKAGAPLRNCMTVVRDGAMLKLSYDLKGIDGLSYRAVNVDKERAPRFVIRRGDIEVASGSFEYG